VWGGRDDDDVALAMAFESPGRGFHWRMATLYSRTAARVRVEAGRRATLKEILLGPAAVNDGTLNLFGVLRFWMGTSGYGTVREFPQGRAGGCACGEDRRQGPPRGPKASGWARTPESARCGGRSDPNFARDSGGASTYVVVCVPSTSRFAARGMMARVLSPSVRGSAEGGCLWSSVALPDGHSCESASEGGPPWRTSS
jgi:hypothetical protein